MLAIRLITAAIVLPSMYFYIMRLPAGYLALLVGVVAAWAQLEFYKMYRVRPALGRIGVAVGALAIAAVQLHGNMAAVLVLGAMAVMSTRLFGVRNPASSLSDVAPVITGIVYIPLMMSAFIPLRAQGPEWIIYLMASIWGADAMAYFVGKSIGRRKLYPSISPNKTVAGAVGSFAGGVAGALVIKALLIPTLAARDAAVSGFVVGGVTIVGDLVESMFKRDAGVKDSGALIPGHGGMLDKIDGALFAGPVLYIALVALGVIIPAA